MMKVTKMEYTIEQGMNCHWFIRENGNLIAGFIKKELAEEVLKLLQQKEL